MPKPTLTWIDKFRVAIRGVRWGITGQASFSIHIPVALIVILLGALLRIESAEWIALIFSIGLVFTAELFNSAIEVLFQGLNPDQQDRFWKSLDIAAGAVLVASLTALVIGCIIFIPRLFAMFQQ
ncbi:MAG: diacylglycerol kinase family protein [Planctomycetia bacterium]|nr:diacylglycerol kinase family protein [Planctomycetia bacterium]